MIRMLYLRQIPFRLPLMLGLAALGVWLGLAAGFPGTPVRGGYQEGEVELDVKSKYSHIKVTREQNVRTLWFVRDSGEEVVESIVDLDRRQELIVEYTRFMFLSYLFRPRPEKALLVGLGGGSMIHFLNHYDPRIKVDVVEIDPVVVDIAARYFGARNGGRVKIHTADGAAYLKNTDSRYDVIYMDAFLKPSAETDSTGTPVRLKNVEFYKDVQKKLNPEGVVVFNLNPHSGLEDDIRVIREAFPQTYLFRLNFGGVVAVGSTSPMRVQPSALYAAAAQLDRRFRTSYSFRGMVRRLED